MDYFEKLRKSSAIDRMVEENLYAEVAKELEKGIRRDEISGDTILNYATISSWPD